MHDQIAALRAIGATGNVPGTRTQSAAAIKGVNLELRAGALYLVMRFRHRTIENSERLLAYALEAASVEEAINTRGVGEIARAIWTNCIEEPPDADASRGTTDENGVLWLT